MTRYYDREILNGLDVIPTPGAPGNIVVIGDAQPILSGKNPGETILAATEYGLGKIFVAAHDCYVMEWFDDKQNKKLFKFINNVKKWLTGLDKLEDKQIRNLDEVINMECQLDDYKIIKWHHDTKVNQEMQARLLDFVSRGGSLFCGATCWGYLQLNPSKRLNDIDLYRFLKDYAGIILTEDILDFPDEIKVSNNTAKYSHFDLAINKITSNPENIKKYCGTLSCGLDVLKKEGILTSNRISDIKDLLKEKCENFGYKAFPSEKSPVKKQLEKNICKLLGTCYSFTEGEKAPYIELFPGDYAEGTQFDLKNNVELSCESKFQERISTGYYLPAGLQIVVNVLSDTNNLENWSIRIGSHCDDLSHCEEIKRWPVITVTKRLEKNMCFSSPFGGLIYFECQENSEPIRVSISNVLESPFIDITKPETINDWNRRKHSPGLWAELCGENIIITTPSDCIKNLPNPVEVMKFWDRVVESHHQLRGTSVRNYRRERVVNDVQPSAGYMHSGYPIVTHLDCCQPEYDECIFDLDKLNKKGCWGMFHELGHNMQRDEWTFSGSVEVTVNLFSMHAMEKIIGHSVTKQKWLLDQAGEITRYFSSTPKYEKWKVSFGLALLTFAQLIKHFGWEPMYKFMREYENDINSNKKSKLPRNNQQKIDQWVIRYSRIINKNIKPHFEFFGLPVNSKDVDKYVREFEPWCPREEAKNPKLFFNH